MCCRRHIHVPEVMETAESDEEREVRQVDRHVGAESSEEEEEDDLSDDEIEKRRMMLRQKMLQRKVQQVRTRLIFKLYFRPGLNGTDVGAFMWFKCSHVV